MKKTLLLSLCFLAVFLSANADRKGTMNIFGASCSYDTVSYRTIAPGSKLFQLKFDQIKNESSTYHMLAHVIEIDMTNPYNKFTTKLSSGGYYAWTCVLDELKHEKNAGKKAVAAMSGFAFTEIGSGSTTTKPAEVSGPMISDSVVYHQDRGFNVNYYYGADRKAYVGTTGLSGTVTVGSENWTIGQVNRFRDKVDAYGEISLFCNGIKKSQVSDANLYTGTEVKVRLLNNRKEVIAGEAIECEVLSVMDGGRNSFADGEAILAGSGSMATKLNTLSRGQRITISVNIVDRSNNKLDVAHLAPMFAGWAIQNGNLNPDMKLSKTATVILGVSEDHTKTYIAALDQNRSAATYRCLAEVLKNLGAYNAIYMDGGPSVDFAVEDKVITDNLCSSYGGRPLGSCFMLYSTAPDDNNIARLEVEDPSAKRINVGSQIEIKAWGYNKYDEVICNDITSRSDVTVTCTNGIGYFQNNTFTATAEGRGSIILTTASGFRLSIPVNVVGIVDLHITPEYIFTGEGRACQAKLWYTEKGNTNEVDPTKAVWSTYNENILKSVEDGLIVPEILGGRHEATVTAMYNGLSATVDVIVEDLDEPIDQIDLKDEIDSDTEVNYQLLSVPHSFTATVETVPDNSVTLKYSTASEDRSVTKKCDNTGTIVFKVDLDYDKAETYPVTVKEISASKPAKIIDLYATYSESTGISSLEQDDNNNMNKSATYTLSGQRIGSNAKYNGIVIKNGKKVSMH